MKNFLDRTGWGDPRPLAMDASARKYYRVSLHGRTAILMHDLAADRREFKKFIEVSRWLRAGQFSAPDIYDADEACGFMLLEDLGDCSFRRAIAQGNDEFELTALAADVLAALTHKDCPLDMLDYYQSNVHKGRRRIVDWFIPAMRKASNTDGLAERYLEIWEDIEYQLPHAQQGFVHVDYHMDNLMWLPERKGLKACGLLDFQGAMRGPVLYDLANLLEDARRDVLPEAKADILETLDEVEQGWVRILATQFHCRVIGQFIKFAIKDGNMQYLEYIPRLQRYIYEGLKDPLLHPMKAFFDDLNLDFSVPCDLNVPEIARHVRDDAF